MTDAIADEARAGAQPGTEILPLTPAWGPAACEGWYDSYMSAAAVLEAVLDYPEPFDGLIMAGFGEHGREGAREVLDVPVVDITEAAAHVACLLGGTFAVVTSLSRTFSLIEESLKGTGTWHRCSGLFATELAVLDLDKDPEMTTEAFVRCAKRAMEKGAASIVLGCAGMSNLYDRLRSEVDIPVIDGVTAAVALIEALVRLGLHQRRAVTEVVQVRRPGNARRISAGPDGRRVDDELLRPLMTYNTEPRRPEG